MGLLIAEGRGPEVHHFRALFDYGHLPPHLRDVSAQVSVIAQNMIDHLYDGPELVAGLRKLREAKDCFVTQAVIDERARWEAEEAMLNQPERTPS